ncbi:MAG: helix-turn-helix domain-containing protein [Candidatus Nanoarchaeia archaeon]|nr:helix-turn-helix domain-containing protein [Candidatus Nanoarchaeia archaeon]
MNLKQALIKIGLTEGESQVYEALVELGLCSTGKITKKANIASSKVYEVLQRLQTKGLVSFIIKNGVKHYDATPPERLIDFLEDKKEEISESQQEIKKILPLIESKRDKKEHNQTIVYTGTQGPKIVLNEILEAGKKGITNYGFGTDIDPYVEHMPSALNKYINTAKKHKFKTKLLFKKGFSSPNTTAEIRFLEEEYLPPARTMIYGDKVAIIDFAKPITTIIIENETIANSYKKHFELLWKIAKK